ncbi:MAG: serine/threonine-protein kinase [Actinomycetes bacterium]
MEPKRPTDPDYLGGWKVTSRLGEGGFGTVFLATKGVQSAAIKVIKEEFLEEGSARERIINEASTLSKLDDIYIGKIIESGLNDQMPWIATEYVNGPTLQEKVHLDQPLDELVWFNLASNLFHALVTAHAAGVIHRDIKPSNIVLGESGNKLIDFGISHVSGTTKSAVIGDFEGSHPFSAPENYMPGRNVPEMDVFSAAATLAYAGTGHSVWSGENPIQLMRSINDDEPNLDGLTELQKEFLRPLFVKNSSERPSSTESLVKATEYLAYLVTNYEGDRPEPLRVISGKRNGFFSKKSILGSLAVLIAGSLIILGTHSSNGNAKSSGLTGAQTATDSSSPLPANPVSIPSITTSSTVSLAPMPGGGTSRHRGIVKSTSAACEDLFNSHSDGAIAACTGPAQSGDARSNYYLGKMYSEQQNSKLAEKYFLRAVNFSPDDIASMGNLVQIYIDTNNTTSYGSWVKKCANYIVKTAPGAHCKLLYGTDLLLVGNVKTALAYLKDAFDWGEVQAATSLGIYYNQQKDVANAIRWLTIGAEAGDSTAKNQLILVAADNNQWSVWKTWVTKAADSGDASSVGKLALYAATIEKDYSAAKSWGLKGAALGDANAMFALGYSYFMSDKDDASAKIWLIKAANKNNVLAMFYLGVIFRLEKSFIDSADWYAKASSAGDLTSTYWAGAVYVEGLKDNVQGCNYFKKTLQIANTQKLAGIFAPGDQSLVDDATTGISNVCTQ